MTRQRAKRALKGRPIATRTTDPRFAKSLYELADKVGASYDQVIRLRRDGLGPEPDGQFSVSKARWFLQQRQERSAQHPGSGAASTWRERRTKAQALAAEIELAERTKQLVAIADVRRAWGLQATKVTNAFSGLGSDLAHLLVGVGPQEIDSIITQRVLTILRALSGEDVFSHSPASKQTDAQPKEAQHD